MFLGLSSIDEDDDNEKQLPWATKLRKQRFDTIPVETVEAYLDMTMKAAGAEDPFNI